ncbi:hypothetical protein, partial [Pseudomonas gingeri]
AHRVIVHRRQASSHKVSGATLFCGETPTRGSRLAGDGDLKVGAYRLCFTQLKGVAVESPPNFSRASP